MICSLRTFTVKFIVFELHNFKITCSKRYAYTKWSNCTKEVILKET